MGSTTRRFPVETTQQLAEVVNLQLIATLTLCISQTNQTLGASFPTEAAPSLGKATIMRTMARWTPLASAKVRTKQHLGSTTPRSRALPTRIMWWTRPSLGLCRTCRIIDQPNSRASSSRPRATTGYSRTTSCCPRRAPTQGCWRLSIIANNQLRMVPSRWLEMCIRITTAQKEPSRAWKCTYEHWRQILQIHKSVLTKIWYGDKPQRQSQIIIRLNYFKHKFIIKLKFQYF